jgi:ATP-dependent helicase HrpA
MEVKVGAGTTVGFPALVDMGESVRLTAFDTEDKARAEHRRGMARLFALQLAAQVKAVEKLPGLRETGAAIHFAGHREGICASSWSP